MRFPLRLVYPDTCSPRSILLLLIYILNFMTKSGLRISQGFDWSTTLGFPCVKDK
jgi:hypothetical protein